MNINFGIVTGSGGDMGSCGLREEHMAGLQLLHWVVDCWVLLKKKKKKNAWMVATHGAG